MKRFQIFTEVRRKSHILAFFSFGRQYDKAPENFEAKTAWERLKVAVTRDQDQNIRPEMSMVICNSIAGYFVGATMGGVIYARVKLYTYVENNLATKYYSKLDAQKRLQDNITLNFLKGSMSLGLRVAFFSAIFSIIYTSIGIIKDKHSIWHLGYAGLITGALYKVSLGFKGMFAGGIVAGCLGLISASIISLILNLKGMTFAEYFKWSSELVNWGDLKWIELKKKKDKDPSTGTQTLDEFIEEGDEIEK